MNTETTPRRARRATALIGGTFAAVLALAACGGNSDTPEGAVENFLDNGIEDLANSMAAGDFEGAANDAEEYLCAEDADGLKEAGAMFEGMSEDEIKDAMGDEALVPEDWSYEIGEVTEDGDTASVEVTMTEDGEDTEETFDLVKEDDAWKICGQFA
ncbi:DUF4878 domain-containing protein [Glycomyces algeriensis]|uniref:DUF4878 domain-containing protein n=1 Tax=Glycomyces algeriensis TaxID=256037 RepID=A0A9W6G805_9ACTN|nr:DUF4878 domain-containing protein [Glycomyces algeriensis]MDA1365913.1 DUF4878 domain-containing protein [Glycomyces algeriensis]MDR7349321.1 hypothetical protein [Glycomyces algeriensis]GLI42022.1 hypothetical protein GALLR39Z86_18720 [Glycomyces algeriensis]